MAASMHLAGVSHDVEEKICELWPIKRLKSYQRDVLELILYDRRDVLVCMPTGSGKSLCFEALTVAAPFFQTEFNSTCRKVNNTVTSRDVRAMPMQENEVPVELHNPVVLVISPLVSLIKKQVSHLNATLRVRHRHGHGEAVRDTVSVTVSSVTDTRSHSLTGTTGTTLVSPDPPPLAMSAIDLSEEDFDYDVLHSGQYRLVDFSLNSIRVDK